MQKVRVPINSFQFGEISDTTIMRTDSSIYAASAQSISNLLVKVDAPIDMIFVANKLLAKEWVKRLQVFHVDPIRLDEYEGLTLDELIRLKRVTSAEVT